MRQEVVLAMLAKEPSYGYELRARLREALGPLGEAMNPGQVYVTLTRLEKTGLVTSRRAEGLADRPDRTVYGLTPAGQERVAEWLAEVSWPKPDLAEFHLKLVAAAAGASGPWTKLARCVRTSTSSTSSCGCSRCCRCACCTPSARGWGACRAGAAVAPRG